MTLHVVQPDAPGEHRSFRLTRPSRPASEVRDDVVLPADRARAILAAASRQDVARAGCFSAGPAGVQVWSGPWDAPDGRAGTARHLGSVDWSWDAPVPSFVTVYRVMVTARAVTLGVTTQALLDHVLALDAAAAASAVTSPAASSLPLPRDPFRRESWNALTDETARTAGG